MCMYVCMYVVSSVDMVRDVRRLCSAWDVSVERLRQLMVQICVFSRLRFIVFQNVDE